MTANEVIPAIEYLEIITAVEEFYNSAWNKLIYTVAVIITIVGVIVPLIFNYLQQKALKISKQEVLTDLSKQIIELKSNLSKEIKDEYQTELKLLKQDAAGVDCHLQALIFLNTEKYENALYSCLITLQKYLISKNYSNIDAVLSMIPKCLKKLSNQNLKNVFDELDTTITKYISELKSLDKEKIIRRKIISLKNDLEKVQKNKTT